MPDGDLEPVDEGLMPHQPPKRPEKESEGGVGAQGQAHEPRPSDAGVGEAGNTLSAVERLSQELNRAEERYVRAVAEFENSRKRLQREKEEFARFASETVIRELLPIVDSLDQALVAVDRQSDALAVVKGIHLIYRQLLGLLDKEGVKRIPTIGERFDPHRHEAVAQIEAGDGVPEETVTEEVQVGYTMHGRVIRPAMVKVAKRSANSLQHTADGTQHIEKKEERSDGEGDRN